MKLTPFQHYMIFIVKPMLRVEHLALIMDGNRRFSKSMGMKQSEGYMRGFNKLLEILEFCSLLRVKTVTIFGFSLLNFNRTRNEISELLNLFVDISKAGGQMDEFTKRIKCRIRFCGDLSFFGDEIRGMLKDIEDKTSAFDKITLNICASYGARNEIANALNNTPNKSPSEFYKNLYTGDCPPPNVLIRTSGEYRLSDFLVYQCSEFTCFYFVKEMWPELTFNRLIYILIHYSVFEPLQNMYNSFTFFKHELKTT